MALNSATTCEWAGYIAEDYDFLDFPHHARVLDLGFGEGTQLRALRARGCAAIGVEYGERQAKRGVELGLPVCRARAECLPIATRTLDGLICKVVIPYTNEARAVAEIARVLRPGGVARVSYHGAGYSLKYLLTDPSWKRRVYGLRTLLNTGLYRLTGLRLPGFMGDTLFQSSRQLQRYYRYVGLELVEEHPAATFGGAPVFIYHTLRKAGW
jgi:SAM-dependent methyltransferase